MQQSQKLFPKTKTNNVVVHLVILLSFFYIESNSQPVFAVQFGSTNTFYDRLDSAVANAQDGSTIYIPGGTFIIGTINIEKRLNLIGVGHNPDSSTATSSTYLSGDINFGAGADYSSLIGIYLSGYIKFYILPGSSIASNILIKRCNLYGISFDQTTSGVIIDECITRYHINVYYGYSSLNTFQNSIITGTLGGTSSGFSNCIIRNNIFLGNYAYQINGGSNIIENNIFMNGTINGNNFCYNNITNSTSNIFSGQLISLNNQINVSDIFINQSGSIYSYTDDYYLTITCPGKNAGTDGTDIGIYGGFSPWKDGSVPYNPHVQFQNIPSVTNANGNLNINIRVGAQDH
ncbi:MAG: hypothetical protein IPP99_00175 [Chitinophagaceae bacterium]|nr:hypothetical protein [Chitinophagaceae bacterium]